MATTTFKSDLSFINSVYTMWNQSVAKVLDIPGIKYSLTFQPIPPAITSKSATIGVNSMGLDPADGPLVLVLLSATWNLTSNDDAVISAAKKLFDDIDEAAKAKGVFNKFKYLNYAAKFQDPIDSYGSVNKANLLAVSQKYDPKQIFQLAVPGGFKIIRSAVG